MAKTKFFNTKTRKTEMVDTKKTRRGTVGKGRKKRNVLRAKGMKGAKLIKFTK